jgi:DNA-binding NarL/FixJ family response regulator
LWRSQGEDKLLKFKFFSDEWETLIANCGFCDDELEIIQLLRRGWAQIDIAAELCISLSTCVRRKKQITEKIIHYISNSSR